LAGETEVLGENLPQRHSVHHKIPHDRPGLEPRAAAVGSHSQGDYEIVSIKNIKILLKISRSEKKKWKRATFVIIFMFSEHEKQNLKPTNELTN
jgi:hypothetical protein